MRDIKFRAIDAMTGKMVYGDLTHNKKVTKTGLEPRVMVGGYEVDPDTVCEYTCFKDMADNEIYEYDIVEYQGCFKGVNCPRFLVKRCDRTGVFEIDRGLAIDTVLACDLCHRYVVVGNVFENQELLGEDGV